MAQEINNPDILSGRKGAALGSAKKWIEVHVSDAPDSGDRTLTFNDDVQIADKSPYGGKNPTWVDIYDPAKPGSLPIGFRLLLWGKDSTHKYTAYAIGPTFAGATAYVLSPAFKGDSLTPKGDDKGPTWIPPWPVPPTPWATPAPVETPKGPPDPWLKPENPWEREEIRALIAKIKAELGIGKGAVFPLPIGGGLVDLPPGKWPVPKDGKDGKDKKSTNPYTDDETPHESSSGGSSTEGTGTGGSGGGKKKSEPLKGPVTSCGLDWSGSGAIYTCDEGRFGAASEVNKIRAGGYVTPDMFGPIDEETVREGIMEIYRYDKSLGKLLIDEYNAFARYSRTGAVGGVVDPVEDPPIFVLDDGGPPKKKKLWDPDPTRIMPSPEGGMGGPFPTELPKVIWTEDGPLPLDFDPLYDPTSEQPSLPHESAKRVKDWSPWSGGSDDGPPPPPDDDGSGVPPPHEGS